MSVTTIDVALFGETISTDKARMSFRAQTNSRGIPFTVPRTEQFTKYPTVFRLDILGLPEYAIRLVPDNGYHYDVSAYLWDLGNGTTMYMVEIDSPFVFTADEFVIRVVEKYEKTHKRSIPVASEHPTHAPSTGFSFGATSSAPSTGFSFGATSSAPSTGFSFGTNSLVDVARRGRTSGHQRRVNNATTRRSITTNGYTVTAETGVITIKGPVNLESVTINSTPNSTTITIAK